jgi:iron complex transport system substrate-binding protein
MQKEIFKRPSSLFFIAIGLIVIGLLLLWASNPKILEREQVDEGVVTVYSCEEPVTFESIPQRTIAMDTNMVEMMLALGLEDHMVGYWISGVEVGEEFKDQIEELELISDVTWPPPSMEVILSFDPDFVFGAWEYNFSEESGVNPQKLEQAGVKTYVLSESCVAAGVKPSESIDSTYNDILNLGKIFKVENRAQELVDEMKGNIQEVQEKIEEVERPLRGFYYGGGADAAFTAGKYAMVTKMMRSVGAENILGDVEDDWIPSAGWETIIEKDPEFIMIDDTPWESAQARIDTLESLPQLESVTAIQEKNYIVFPWTYILPGVQMDDGIALLAKGLYPEKF